MVTRKKMAVFQDVAPCSLVSIFQTTQCYIPKDSHLYSYFCPSALKVETVCSSEVLVCTYKSTLHYNTEDNIDIFTTMRTSNLTSVLKMEVVCSYEMLVSTYKSTRHYNPEDQRLCQRLRFCKYKIKVHIKNLVLINLKTLKGPIHGQSFCAT
jgi:hypothetical protein